MRWSVPRAELRVRRPEEQREPRRAARSASTASGATGPAVAGSNPPLQVFQGPFGSGRYGHLKLTITQVRFPDSGLTLLVGDRPPVAAQRINQQGDFSPSVKAQDTSVREFGFTVDGDLSPEQLQLRYSTNTVPVTIAVLASPVPPDPYPLTATPPKAFSYNGALQPSCTVMWTVTIDAASVALDIPADLRSTSGPATNRVPAGSRWLVLDGVVTTGPAKGSSCRVGRDQGSLTKDSFRLVMDGRPFAPLVAR